MREKDLPSPKIGSKGYHLRRIVAAAVSYVQTNAYANGRHPSADDLSAFLAAAKTAVDLLTPVAATTSFTPSAKTYSIAAGPTAGPVLAVGGYDGKITYTSATPARATVNAATGVITGVSAGTSVITATMPAAGGFLAKTTTYTATVTA